MTGSPFSVLRSYLEARASFSEDDLAIVRSVLRDRRLEPGEALQRAGDVAQAAAFVAHGCHRSPRGNLAAPVKPRRSGR